MKQSGIVAAVNMIWANFASLLSSHLLEFGFIAGSLFLTPDVGDKDDSTPAVIDRKVRDDQESASQQYWALIKRGLGMVISMATATSASIVLMP